MTELETPNPFAAPRANVERPFGETGAGGVVDATRGQRLLAELLDSVPVIGLFIVVAIVAAISAGSTLLSGATPQSFLNAAGGALLMVGLGCLAMMGWGVYNLVLVYRYGQNWGKRMMGIRVVTSDGSRASLPRIVFLRWGLLCVIGFFVGIVGAVTGLTALGNLLSLVDVLMIFGAARLCLHDRLGGTRVVTAASSEHATLEGHERLAAGARA